MTSRLDLICLVADFDQERTLEALLGRPDAFGIRRLRFEIYRHPEHDPGCRRQAASFLRNFQKRTDHALVIFDLDGSGAEGSGRAALEAQVEAELRASGWSNNSAVLVIDPELENWLWNPSPHVERCLGWDKEGQTLRAWLEETGLWPKDRLKPPSPKDALERAIWETRIPRSSSIYRELASKVSLKSCQDPAFEKLRSTLSSWFAKIPPADET